MKILALGATGAIGGELAHILARAGHDVHVTTRQFRPSDEGINYIQGNALDDGFLAQVLRTPWDAIVDFMVYDTAKFLRRTEALTGATDQYVYTSSARVFADSSVPLTESSPRLLDVLNDPVYLATDEYALSKARQEDLLRNSARRNWTIIRPYITFSEGRLQLGPLEKEGWLYRALKGRSIVFCDALARKATTLTDGRDVARMISSIIGCPAALGEDYNLVNSQTVTWGEVLSLYLDVLEAKTGIRPRVELVDLNAFCRMVSSVPQVMFDRVYDRKFNPEKIGSVFDLSTIQDPMEALRGRLRDQLDRKNGFGEIDWRGEAIRARYLREHTGLREIPGMKSRLRYLAYRHVPPGMIQKMRKV